MNNRQEILDELKSIGSMLAGLPRTMPYHVPDGYFDELRPPGHASEDSDLPEPAPGWSKTMPFHVPDGYFEALAYNVAGKAISGEGLGLSRTMPYGVPEGYFDSLPGTVLAAAKADIKKDSKVIPVKPRHLLRPVNWAAAAIVFICISIGGYMLFSAQNGPEKILASVSNNDIKDYLQHTYRIDMDKVVNSDLSNLQLDNKDIVEYLDETGWDSID